MSFQYIDGLFPDWGDEIWWVANSLDELVKEGILSPKEGKNLVESLYYKK